MKKYLELDLCVSNTEPLFDKESAHLHVEIIHKTYMQETQNTALVSTDSVR